MQDKKLSTTFLLKHYSHFLALGFGSGLSPKAPGTMGTFAAIPLVFVLQPLTSSMQLAVIAILAIWGISLCGKTADDAGVHDHGAIVWDEIVGYLITMWLSPLTWLNIILGFVLFRFFDIVKPWPIGWVDKKCHGGLGIMLDDILAGVAAFTCLQLIQIYF
jgi:phosphatidylglycerophosphatase A